MGALAVKQQDYIGHIYADADEQRRLAAVLDVYYVRILRTLHGALAGAVPTIDFRLDDPAVRQILLEAAWRVVRIDNTTRTAIAEQLQIGHEKGYSLQQMADGVPEEGYRGINGLFKETWKNRGVTVARTELGHATLIAARNRYLASGVVDEVEIVDGTDFDDACRRRNGKRVPVATHVELNHPNCTVATIPIVRQDAFA
jgi:hypothetical protein